MTATAFRFLLRPDLVIAQPVVGRAKALVKRDCPAAFLRPARETGFHRVVAADFSVVRSLPELGPFAFPPLDLCRRQIGLVTVDPWTVVVDLFAVAVPERSAAGFAVSVVVVVSPAAADRLRLSRIADSVCLVCSSAAVMEKGKVVAPGFSYFLVPRFSSLRNRSFLSPLCLAVPA